jgi:hypothetical protein
MRVRWNDLSGNSHRGVIDTVIYDIDKGSATLTAALG